MSSESTKQGEEWGPLQDLVEKWREYGNSPVPKNTGGMPKEEYHAARMQALVCADQLAALAPLLARKVEEARREEALDWNGSQSSLTRSAMENWAKQRLAELEKRT